MNKIDVEKVREDYSKMLPFIINNNLSGLLMALEYTTDDSVVQFEFKYIKEKTKIKTKTFSVALNVFDLEKFNVKFSSKRTYYKPIAVSVFVEEVVRAGKRLYKEKMKKGEIK